MLSNVSSSSDSCVHCVHWSGVVEVVAEDILEHARHTDATCWVGACVGVDSTPHAVRAHTQGPRLGSPYINTVHTRRKIIRYVGHLQSLAAGALSDEIVTHVILSGQWLVILAIQ